MVADINQTTWTVSMQGASAASVPALADLLLSDDCNVRAAAALELAKRAASSQQNKDAITRHRYVLDTLAYLLKSSIIRVVAAAACALGSIAAGSQQNKDAIFATDALAALVDLSKSAEIDVQRAAAETLDNLALGSQQNKDAVLAAQLQFKKTVCCFSHAASGTRTKPAPQGQQLCNCVFSVLLIAAV